MIARALPSCLTVGNLLLGIVSILLAFQDSWEYAAIMVIFGMILDGLDGRVARMLNTQSEFGKRVGLIIGCYFIWRGSCSHHVCIFISTYGDGRLVGDSHIPHLRSFEVGTL